MKFFAAFLLLSAFVLSGCPGGQAGVQITTTTLPTWVSGQQSSFVLQASGGVPPYTWTLATGSNLPSGFTLSANGVISGSSTLALGTSSSVSPPFLVVVKDSKGNSVQKSFNIMISGSGQTTNTTSGTNTGSGPVLTINTLTATCYFGMRCDQPIATAQGGTPPYHFQSDTFANGAPPFGMTVDVNGHILGTSKTEGTYTVGVCAVDTAAASKCGQATVIVNKINSLNGTWSGAYIESQSSDPCIFSNSGTLTWTITATGNSFSGTLTDTGTGTVTGGGQACTISPGGYSITGTVDGSISENGQGIAGTMIERSQGNIITLPFSGTVQGDTMTLTYTGSDTTGATFSGPAFTMRRQ